MLWSKVLSLSLVFSLAEAALMLPAWSSENDEPAIGPLRSGVAPPRHVAPTSIGDAKECADKTLFRGISIPPKSEFQPTSEYQNSVKKIISNSLQLPDSGEYECFLKVRLKYDADKAIFKYNLLEEEIGKDIIEGPSYEVYDKEGNKIVLRSTIEKVFGFKFPPQYTGLPVDFSVSPSAAEAASQSLAILIKGNLYPPYYYFTKRRNDPAPQSVGLLAKMFIVIRPIKLTLFDLASNKVYADKDIVECRSGIVPLASVNQCLGTDVQIFPPEKR